MLRLQGCDDFEFNSQGEIMLAHLLSWTAGSIAVQEDGARLSKSQIPIFPTVLSFADYIMALNFALQIEVHWMVCNTLYLEELGCMWRLHKLYSHSVHNVLGYARHNNLFLIWLKSS